MTGSQPQPTPGATGPDPKPLDASKGVADLGTGDLVKMALENFQTIVNAELELAKLELRSTIKNAGVGAGAFIGAVVVLLFSLTFGFFALAEGLAAAGLYRWLAFLVVFVFQLLVVGGLVFLGIRKIKRVRAPERTIATSKETVAYLREHG